MEAAMLHGTCVLVRRITRHGGSDGSSRGGLHLRQGTGCGRQRLIGGVCIT